MTREELNELIRSSPPEGHKALIDEYANYVYTIVFLHLRNCGTREDIEECVSDIFAEVLMKFQENSFYSGDMKNSIGTLAKRRAVNYYNRLTRVNSRQTVLREDTGSECDFTDITEKKEMQRLLFDCIERLGKPDSEIVLMKYYYGLKAKDIARRLAMNAENVQKRSERAMKKLEELLEEAGIGSDDYE